MRSCANNCQGVASVTSCHLSSTALGLRATKETARSQPESHVPCPPCAQGRTVSFKNTIVVMTSNLGSGDILDTMTALDADLLRERVMQQVHR